MERQRIVSSAYGSRRSAIALLWICATALAIAPLFAEAQEQRLSSLTWLLGTWSRPAPQGRATERWVQVDERLFRGEGRARIGAGGGRVLESLLLVELDGEVFYLAKVPENTYPVPFRLTASSETRAVFENPSHDFPQRLEYTLVDGGLHVKVSAEADEGFTLRFRRAAH